MWEAQQEILRARREGRGMDGVSERRAKAKAQVRPSSHLRFNVADTCYGCTSPAAPSTAPSTAPSLKPVAALARHHHVHHGVSAQPIPCAHKHQPSRLRRFHTALVAVAGQQSHPAAISPEA
eukprot:jgi/Ulvmu1/11791/UM080_0001.1